MYKSPFSLYRKANMIIINVNSNTNKPFLSQLGRGWIDVEGEEGRSLMYNLSVLWVGKGGGV